MLARLSIAALTLATPAIAQDQCADADIMEFVMAAQFLQTPKITHFDPDNGTVHRLFSNPYTGTWSIVAYLYDGRACVLMDGVGRDL